MTKKSRLERISQMEDRFDEVTRVMAALDEAVSEYEDFKSEIKALQDYLESGQWKEDFEADEAGKIPACVKRGVLSEDGLYDLLEESDRILERAREILA